MTQVSWIEGELAVDHIHPSIGGLGVQVPVDLGYPYFPGQELGQPGSRLGHPQQPELLELGGLSVVVFSFES